VHRKTKRIARECVWVGWCAHTHTQKGKAGGEPIVFDNRRR